MKSPSGNNQTQKDRKPEWFLGIGLLLIALYVWLVTSVPWARQLSGTVWRWLMSLGETQGYIGGFVASFLANFSILIPFPYTVVIVLIAATGVNPFILGIVSGIGAGLGESSSYFLGYFGQSLTKDIYRKNLVTLRHLIAGKRWYVYLILFLIGATPIPDDIFIIPLGFLRFGFFRMLLPVSLGKTLTIVLICLFVKYSSVTTALVDPNTTGLIPNILTLVATVAAVYIMLKVDWERIGTKLVGKQQETNGDTTSLNNS